MLKLAALLPFALAAAVPAQECAAPIPKGVTRTWVGPEFYGARLQDWRVHDGWIECLRADRRHPIRVMHWLTPSIRGGDGDFTVTVRLRPLGRGQLLSDAFAGLLLGVGRLSDDWRTRALVHHRPGRDGGVAIGASGQGKLVLRDFGASAKGGGLWSIAGPLKEGEFRVLAESEQDGLRPRSVRAELVLTVRVRVSGERAALLCKLREGGDDEEVELQVELPANLLEGGIGLVSHRGTQRAGFAFSELSARGGKIRVHEERRFGPVLGTLYTMEGGTLKLTAQMPPLGEDDVLQGTLELAKGDAWEQADVAVIDPDARTLRFRAHGVKVPAEGRAYRVRYRLRRGFSEWEDARYEGTLRAEPGRDDELVLGAFSCVKHYTGGLQWNSDRIWFPHADLVARVQQHDPDMLFFAGDQIYEGDITGAQRRPLGQAQLDYLDKWYRWVWSFGELTRHRPSVVIPDDHDVYHGNLWGAGGRKAKRQDDGGYTMPARFVRMVERTQTSHLPDPFDPAPVQQGIGVYYTSLDWGGVSFAVLEDRKFKDSATPTVPAGKFVNGWAQAEGFDPAKDADVPGAQLLGERQHVFLEHWAQTWKRGAMMKAVLSQTIFHNLATLPPGGKNGSASVRQPYLKPGEYPKDWIMAADTDSNGWPQSARDAALRIFRKAAAVHIAGDQHLPSLSQYGIDGWRDAGWAFCVPAVGNTWPRRFWPPVTALVHLFMGYDDKLDGNFEYYPWREHYRDGFGNKMYVEAVANPMKSGREPAALHDRMPGYGIVRFDKKQMEIGFECWPRWADKGERQFPGWPVTVPAESNMPWQWVDPAESPQVPRLSAQKEVAWLPFLRLEGMAHPLLQVFRTDGTHVYSVRVRAGGWSVPVPEAGSYELRVGEPGTTAWRVLRGVKAAVSPPLGNALVIELK